MVKWFATYVSCKFSISLLFYVGLIFVGAQDDSKQHVKKLGTWTNTSNNANRTAPAPARSLESDDIFNDEFVSAKHFVDKSDLLRVFFEDYRKRHFITCPSGFGKTTNLHMIREFCQLELNENNAITPWNESKAYALFEGTKIMRNQSLLVSKNHMARHAVVHLDFNCSSHSFVRHHHQTDADGDKKMTMPMVMEMNRQLAWNFKPYTAYIKQYYNANADIWWNLTLDFQNWLNSSIRTAAAGTMGDDDFSVNFANVVQTFLTVFDGDIVVLIDNQDYYVNPKFKNMQSSMAIGVECLQKLLDDALIDAIDKYEHRLYLLITGISSISFYRRKLHEYVDHSNFAQDTKYAAYFGLLEAQVQELFDRYDTHELERTYIRKYYNSYKTALHRYSTFQLTNYFANRIKQTSSSVTIRRRQSNGDRFVNSTECECEYEYVRLFLKQPRYLEDVAKLLKHCSVGDDHSFDKTYNNVAVADLARFENCLTGRGRKNFDTLELVPHRLLHTMSFEHGFIGRAKDGSYVIPNYETRRLFEAELRYYFENHLFINVTEIGVQLLDMFYKTANKTGDVSSQVKQLLAPAYQRLQPVIGGGGGLNRCLLRNFTFALHSILHLAALTNDALTVVDDYPQPVSHQPSVANFDRRCVTLITGAGVAVVFKITLDRSAKIAMEQAMTYAYQSPHIKYLKYVGVNVDSYGSLEADHCPKSYFLQKGEKPVSEELEKFTINFEDILMKQEEELQQQEQEQQQQQQQQQELQDEM